LEGLDNESDRQAQVKQGGEAVCGAIAEATVKESLTVKYSERSLLGSQARKRDGGKNGLKHLGQWGRGVCKNIQSP
jgi:hypothetical protein